MKKTKRTEGKMDISINRLPQAVFYCLSLCTCIKYVSGFSLN